MAETGKTQRSVVGYLRETRSTLAEVRSIFGWPDWAPPEAPVPQGNPLRVEVPFSLDNAERLASILLEDVADLLGRLQEFSNIFHQQLGS